MTKRKYKWRRYYLVVIVIVFFVLAFFLIPFVRQNEVLSPLSSLFSRYTIDTVWEYLILPTQQTYTRYWERWKAPVNDQINRDMENQLINLKRQIQIKDSLIQELNYLKIENQTLRALLSYRSNITYTTVPAEIISYEPQNHFYFFWVAAGERQSLSNKMPVVAFNQKGEQGLVGFVVEVHEESSLVQSILDPQTHVGILVEGYDIKAILKGDKTLDRLLTVNYINNEFTNLEGRHVLTSGIGERYPKGINIGTIISTESSIYGLFQSALVKPLLDFTSLKDVLIITAVKE